MLFAEVIIGDSRSMFEINDKSIDLIVTSPPYWTVKNYEVEGQIGFGQTLHDYFKDLFLVWEESFRVLKEGARLCINIADVYLSRKRYGKYKVVPLHAEIINQCERIGFDYMGSIIWKKIVTVSGGRHVLGSYPFPPSGILKIKYEFILVFKKPGVKKAPSPEIRKASALTKKEWITYFDPIWEIHPVRQTGGGKEHIAVFPIEIPMRLIKMFSFVGDVVLDPFLGSGTTSAAAVILNRNSIGYEINPKYKEDIEKSIDEAMAVSGRKVKLSFRNREKPIIIMKPIWYKPCIRDIKP